MTEIIKGYRWWIIGLLFFNVAIGMISYEIMSPLFGEISRDISLDPAQFGLIMGVFHFASPLFTPIGGIFVDRIGARRVLLFSLLLIGCAGAARTLVVEPWIMIFITFLMGIGFAPVGSVIVKSLGGLFSQAQMGKAVGFGYAAIGLGNSFALATGASVLSPTFGGWRPTLLVIALVCISLGVLWYLVFRDDVVLVEDTVGTPQGNSDSFFDGAKIVLRQRNMWLLCFGMFLTLFAYWGLVVHLAPTLDARGLENFGAYAAVMTGTGLLFNLLGGALSDWLGRRRPVLIGSVLLLPCTIPGMLLLDEGWPLVLNMVVAGMAVGPVFAVAPVMALEMKGVGRALAGTAVGVMWMFGNIGSVLGPVVMGYALSLADARWPAFTLVSVSLLLAAVPIYFIREHNDKKAFS